MGNWFSTEGSYRTVNRKDIRIGDPYKVRRTKSKELQLDITPAAKRNFTGIPDERDKLFDRQIVPVSVKTIPVEVLNGIHLHGYRVQSIAVSTSTKTNFVLDQNTYSTYLKVINPDGSDKKTRSLKKFHMVVCWSGTNMHDHGECCLTLPSDREVHKVTINTDNVMHVLHFKTSGECWGIAEFDDGFAVSVKVVTGYSLPDWQVQYLDAKGNIKRQIYYDSDNKPLFSKPNYLASNPTHDTLYVSDCAKHEIIALDVFGKVVFLFSHSDLKIPLALTVDDEDNVYVACGDSVVQIHKSGSKHRVLIEKNKGNPDILSVCFNTESRTLIVGEASSRIKTFNFLPQ